MHTIYHFQYKKKITLNYSKSAAMEFLSKGLKNESETAVINETSVFEPLKVYCVKVSKLKLSSFPTSIKFKKTTQSNDYALQNNVNVAIK